MSSPSEMAQRKGDDGDGQDFPRSCHLGRCDEGRAAAGAKGNRRISPGRTLSGRQGSQSPSRRVGETIPSRTCGCAGATFGAGSRRPLFPGTSSFRLMAYRLQAQTFGDLDRATVRILERMAEAERSASDRSSSAAADGSLSATRAARSSWRRSPDPEARNPIGPRLAGPARTRDGCPRRVRLEWRDLQKPLRRRLRDHEHKVERPSILRRAASGSRQGGRAQRRSKPTQPERERRRLSASACQDNEPFAEHGSPDLLASATSDLPETVL